MTPFARIALLLTVIAACVGSGWLLMRESGDPRNARSDPAPAARTPDDAQRPPSEPASAVSSSGFDERDRPLESWFSERKTALAADETRTLWAIEWAIRHALVDVDAPAVTDLLKGDRIDGADLLPLWIDVHGPPSRSMLEAWMPLCTPRDRMHLLARARRLGDAAYDVVRAMLDLERTPELRDACMAFLLLGESGTRPEALLDAESPPERVVAVVNAVSSSSDLDRARHALRDLMALPFDHSVRNRIGDRLAGFCDDSQPESLDALTVRMGDPDPMTRAAVLSNAGNFMDDWKKTGPKPEDILRVRDGVRLAATGDADPYVRRAAVMSRVGMKDGIKNLTEQCNVLLEIAGNDPDGGVRAAVLHRVHRGCAHTKPPFGPAYLRPYVEGDPDPWVRLEAIRTLPRYAGMKRWEEAARALLLWSLRNDHDTDLRLEAAIRLRELGREPAIAHLQEAAANDTDAELRRTLRTAAVAAKENAPFSAETRFDRLTAAFRDRDMTFTPDFHKGIHPDGSWSVTGFTVRVDDPGIDIRGTIRFHPERRVPVLLIVPSDPLLGGMPAPLPDHVVARAATAHGYAVVTFEPRGRGGSDGWSGRGDGERADVEAVLAWLRDPSRHGSDMRLGEVRVLELVPWESPPASAHQAYERALRRHDAERLRKRLERFIAR